MARYKHTQESGTTFKVNTSDKCDATEDTNEVRQIVQDLGNLLGHSKFDDSYPKDATEGGDIDINRVTTKSAVATLTTAEAGFIKVSAAAGYSLTLPTAIGNKLTYIFVKTDDNANLITIDGHSTETINGSLTYTGLNSQYAYVAIRSDNANWFILFRSGAVNTSGTPVDNDFAKFTDADTIEGRSYSEVRTDLGLVIGTNVLAEQTIGIANDNLVEIDDADAADNDFAKFTANGLEGRSYAEVKIDLGIETDRNLIGIAGAAGFGVGIAPEGDMPEGMTPLTGYKDPYNNNYGNYQYKDGSVMVWVPKFYYLISTNTITIKGIDTYPTTVAANADGYALHRAFIDGGVEKDGFFVDKYMISKQAWGTGHIGSSLKNGLPISTHADHNPIADLTACGTNAYFELIDAAHARDGINGAVNASSIFFSISIFIGKALAMLALAHAQASSATTYCAWYNATYNYPKGCNNNALRDVDDNDVLYVTDGYSQCGKTGSGTPFAKTTHNGQECGVADLNGLMWEVSIGATCIASTMAITGASQANPCVITVADTSALTTGDMIMITGVVGMTELNNKLYKITVIDGTTFSLDDIDSTGYTAWSSGGTITYGTFYVAKSTTAMKDFDSSNAGATDHWGATGVAAMMDALSAATVASMFKSGNAFAMRYGSGANQVLDEATSGEDWVKTGMAAIKSGAAVDGTGTNQFGKDYYYQYIRNELCLLSCGDWLHSTSAGVWHVLWHGYRTYSNDVVGGRFACYPE